MEGKQDNWFDGLEIDDFDLAAARAQPSADDSQSDAAAQTEGDNRISAPITSSLRLTTNGDWPDSISNSKANFGGGRVISPFLPGSLAEHLAADEQPKPAKQRDASIDGPFESFLSKRCSKPVVLHVRSIGDRIEGCERLILSAPRFAESTYLRIAGAYIHRPGDAGIASVESEAEARGCPLWRAPRRGLAGWRTVRSLAKLCRKLRVAVWHSHDYRSNRMGRLISRVWKMKLVTTVHHWPRQTWQERLAYHADQWGLRRFDRIITVSPQLRQNLIDNGHDANRIEFISTGIDTEQFSRKHDIRAARYELGVSPDATVIGVIARFSKDKGVDRAIKTINDLKGTYPNVELHLIGDGPEYEALKELARQRHVANRVHFWGWQSSTQRLYEMMDVLLVPSRSETTPSVVLEAMSMGVPVAATKTGNVPEMLKGGRRGVLLSNRNRTTWADHLAPLLVSEPRREEMGRQGRLRVEKYYSFDHTMNQIMSVYDRVLSIDPKHEDIEWRRAA